MASGEVNRDHVFYRNPARFYPTVERGRGVYLYGADGKRYLDGSGGAAVAAVGHGCREIERAVVRLGNGAMCLLSGGAAALIGEHLGIAQRRVDNLVLEGLLRLAGDLPAAHASGKTNS